MLIEAYVEGFQAGEIGRPIRVGDVLLLSILASPGSALGPETPLFDAYVTPRGKRALKKVGLAEYVFSGRVEAVTCRAATFWESIIYREVLVDCGIPVLFVTHGVEASVPFNLRNPQSREIIEGDYLGGLASFHASMGLIRPVIGRSVRAKTTKILRIDLNPSSPGFGSLTEVEATTGDSSPYQPLVLEIDIEGT